MLNAKIKVLLFLLVWICTSSCFCRIIAFTIAGTGAKNIVLPGWQPIAHCFQNCCHGPWINSGMETIQAGAWTFGSNWSVATATALASIYGFASQRNCHCWHSSCICGASQSEVLSVPHRYRAESVRTARIPIGNSGTQYHPNSREFVQSVRPDSDRKGQFRSDNSELFPTSSNRFQSERQSEE